MRAEFPNPTNYRMLMPGQFVRVRLIGATYKDAVLIPSSAVLSTPTGDLVYVVQEDNTVKSQPVKVQLQDNMYIVSEGLEGGETIVSEGLIKIRPDMPVAPEMKTFELPKSAVPTQPSTTTAINTETFDEAIQRDEQSDVQVLPETLPAGQAPAAASTGTVSTK